jgi:hypothetical protein
VWAIQQILPPPWSVVLGRIFIGAFGARTCESLSWSWIDSYLLRVPVNFGFPEIPPFARVHRIPKICAIFLNLFGRLLVGMVSS